MPGKQVEFSWYSDQENELNLGDIQAKKTNKIQLIFQSINYPKQVDFQATKTGWFQSFFRH